MVPDRFCALVNVGEFGLSGTTEDCLPSDGWKGRSSIRRGLRGTHWSWIGGSRCQSRHDEFEAEVLSREQYRRKDCCFVSSDNMALQDMIFPDQATLCRLAVDQQDLCRSSVTQLHARPLLREVEAGKLCANLSVRTGCEASRLGIECLGRRRMKMRPGSQSCYPSIWSNLCDAFGASQSETATMARSRQYG